MIRVTLTVPQAFWYTTPLVGTDSTPESYAANPFVFAKQGFQVDLREELDAPLPYDQIFGLTLTQLRLQLGAATGEIPEVIVSSARRGILGGSPLADTMIAAGALNFMTDGQQDGPAVNGGDRLYGNAGDDLYVLYSSASRAFEFVTTLDGQVLADDAGGEDTVVLTEGDYTLAPFLENLILNSGSRGIGNAEDNDILGNAKVNDLSGLDGDDLLLGFGGDDLLSGGGGADILWGSTGNDRISGGDGVDLFFFESVRRTGRDAITDFDGEDLLVTRNLLRDRNGDGVITFADNGVLDFSSKASVAITGADGASVTALEYDGAYEQNGVTLYVYSLPGSLVGVADAQALDLNGILINL